MSQFHIRDQPTESGTFQPGWSLKPASGMSLYFSGSAWCLWIKAAPVSILGRSDGWCKPSQSC